MTLYRSFRTSFCAHWFILLAGMIVIAEIIAIVLLIANFDALKLVRYRDKFYFLLHYIIFVSLLLFFSF